MGSVQNKGVAQLKYDLYGYYFFLNHISFAIDNIAARGVLCLNCQRNDILLTHYYSIFTTKQLGKLIKTY